MGMLYEYDKIELEALFGPSVARNNDWYRHERSMEKIYELLAAARRSPLANELDAGSSPCTAKVRSDIKPTEATTVNRQYKYRYNWEHNIWQVLLLTTTADGQEVWIVPTQLFTHDVKNIIKNYFTNLLDK